MPEQRWEALQKIVFARYVQQKLRQQDEYKTVVVNDILEEVKDSNLLVQLLEVLSGKKLEGKGLTNPCKNALQKIENANKAMAFITSCIPASDMKAVRCSPEDIVNEKDQSGSQKAVLGLIFQIIVSFLKFDEGDDAASVDLREGLCLWLNNKLDAYGAEVKLSDKQGKIPTKAFHDGMIFNYLVHKMRPKLLDVSALDPANGQANLEQALDLGEKYLGIDKYVSAADITQMDELSIIVYLSDWFNGVVLLQKQDIAARRVGKLVDLTILHDKLKAEYSDAGAGVAAWVASKIEKLNLREFDDTLSGVRRLLEEFYAYKGTEKGEYIGKKLDCTGLFNNLQARLANHKRPVWAAPAGTSPTELDTKFVELGEVEIKRSVDLNQELARQLKLHRMYNRFQGNDTKLRTWASDKKAYVDAREAIDSVEAGEDALEGLGVYEKEQAHVSGSQLADLKKLMEELVAERFEHSAAAKSAAAALDTTFSALQASCTQKRAHLESALQAQKDLNDRLCKTFADAASAFESWLSAKRAALSAGSDNLDAQLAQCKADEADTAEAETKLADLAAKDKAVADRNIALNPYSNLTSGDLQSEWTQFLVLIKKKIELLEEQMEEAKRGGLTLEQAAEIDANFAYFDKDNNGFLGIKELRVCLQSLGEESRPQDIANLLEKFDVDKSKTIKKSEFVEFMKANLGDSGSEAEMLTAFKYLCYSKDHIVEVELMNVVNDKSFKDHHVEYLKKEMAAKDAGYDYTAWTAAAFAR